MEHFLILVLPLIVIVAAVACLFTWGALGGKNYK